MSIWGLKLGGAGGAEKAVEEDAEDKACEESPDITKAIQARRRQASSNFIWFINEYNLTVHAVFAVVWVTMGVCMFCQTEHCWIITAIYVIVQIVTTIGYGDITPTNDIGKILTSFYALGTILFLGSLVNMLIDAINSRVEAAEAMATEATAAKKHRISVSGPAGEALLAGPPQRSCLPSMHDIHHRFKAICGLWHDTVHEFTIFALFVLSGTVFYALYEKCVCSYGLDLVVGCVDTSVAVCTATGGYTQTWVTSFYMCVITLATIGFGDYAPKSFLGRILFIPWAIMGVMAMAKFATSFGIALAKWCEAPEPAPTDEKLKASFQALVGYQKSVNRLEFMWFVLNQTGQINPQDAKMAFAAFDNLKTHDDTEQFGSIGVDEALAYVQSHLGEDEEDD